MAAVLVVLYIPCDNEDEDKENGGSNEGKDGGNDADRTTSTTTNPTPPTSNSNHSGISVDSEHISEQTTNPTGEIENGDIVLLEKKGSEHLPLLEYAADSPVVATKPRRKSTEPEAGEETGGGPEAGRGETAPGPVKRRVRIAGEDGEGEGETVEIGDEGGRTEEVEEPKSDSWSLEDALQELLGRLKVDNDVWVRTDDETILQVTFVVAVEEVDAILRDLTAFGLGSIPHTSITTFPASFHREQQPKVDEQTDKEDADGMLVKSKKNVPDEKSDFIKTIKSRLTVAQVVAAVEGNARATFDFIMLICLASFIAALGLVENSSVVLVASMLISPLMGPILGGVFGSVIQNRNLTLLGVKNALIGLALCLVVGFLFGLAVAGVNSHGTLWGGSTMWPTEEMRSRGMTRSLWVGVLIALPSGAGVALSVLGGNVGSLVGVAISASLLPPAVNAGMLWAYSLISAITPPQVVAVVTTVATTTLPTVTAVINNTLVNLNNTDPLTTSVPPPHVMPVPPHCPALQDNAYRFVYSCTMAHEAAVLGAVSLFLTFLNILCIFLMGVLVLKIKEVAPHTTVSPVTEIFWKKDLPIARDCYKTLKGKDSLDAAKMAKDIAKEWKKKHDHLDPNDMRKSWHYMLQDLEHSANINDVADLQPTAAPRRHTFMRNLSYQGHTIITEDVDPRTADTLTPLSYHTTYSSDSTNLRQRNFFFANADSRPTPSPSYHTPPTSVENARFNQLTVHRAQKPRIPRHVQRQQSLTTEIEKAVMKNLPERLGRFTISQAVIKEEEQEDSQKSPQKEAPTPKSTPEAPFILKLPEKKSPESVVVDVDDTTEQLTAKERRDRFFDP